jgi:hypothetical protein
MLRRTVRLQKGGVTDEQRKLWARLCITEGCRRRKDKGHT